MQAPFHKLDRKIRISSAVVDHFSMTMLAGIFFVPDIIFQILKSNKDNSFQDPYDSGFAFIVYIGFALYFCKDVIQGQSIGKRIFKLQIINSVTGLTASPYRCFVRDLFLILFPIEIIMIFINPEKRLGDIVAGTRLVIADYSKTKKIDLLGVIIVFILAYLMIFCLYFIEIHFIK